MQLVEGIYGFEGEHRFLSNFWVEPDCFIEFEGLKYKSTEHAYVAAKTLDQNIRKQIAEVITLLVRLND